MSSVRQQPRTTFRCILAAWDYNIVDFDVKVLLKTKLTTDAIKIVGGAQGGFETYRLLSRI